MDVCELANGKFGYKLRGMLKADSAAARLRKVGRLLTGNYENPPVFIYQMGKVGSKSLSAAIDRVWCSPVVHAHSIGGWRTIDANMLYRKVIKRGKGVYIITLVREPISRNVSAYFERHKNNRGGLRRGVQYLIADFLYHHNHTLTLRWFDKFFLPYIKTDVYNWSFNNGYCLINKEKMKILVLKAETCNDRQEGIVEEFLGLDRLRLSGSNVSGDRWYGDIYERFKERFRPPEWYRSMMYESKYYLHFYGEDGLKWVKKSHGRNGVSPWDEGLIKNYYENMSEDWSGGGWWGWD